MTLLSWINRHLIWFSVFVLALALPLLGQPDCWAEEGTQLKIVADPYRGVDWESIQHHKANFHTHTTESDGGLKPEQVIDEYRNRGYTILAITDHNRCTFPWTKWDRDPVALGMLAVAGNELSRHHHAGSLFVPFETRSEKLEQSLEEVRQAGGLAMLNHPGRYWKPDDQGRVPSEVLDRYVGWFRQFDHLIGMEIVNQRDRYPHDRMLWDALLGVLMPDRPVWGFANDDMHSSSALGINWNVLLLKSLDEEEVREALQTGRFYICSVSVSPAESRDVSQTPKLVSVVHDSGAGTITLKGESGGEPLPEEQYVWISQGRVVHRGPMIHYRKVQGIFSYLRAELHGKGGITFTNPFGFAR
jgi:hypothetical protein